MKNKMNRRDGNQMQQQTTYDIYVGNVPKSLNQEKLKQLCNKYGEVKQAFCRWKDDSFGYGIVKFVYKQDADRFLRENEEIFWNGHSMPVRIARRSEHNSQNGNTPFENKSNPCPDMNKNLFYPKISNIVDHGYFHHPAYNNEQPPHSHPMMLEVLCTAVENAITFYGCSVNRTEELAMIMNALNSMNLSPNRQERKPSPLKVYAALYSEDNSWYRCAIIQNVLPNKPGMCSVRYIDYGNVEEISYRNIVEIPESLQKIPPISTKYVFSNLVYDSMNTSNKKSCLHQLINKRMTLCAYLSCAGREYSVVKCSCNGKDVILDTINKGFAKPLRSVSARHDFQHYDSKPNAFTNSAPILPESRSSLMYNSDVPQIFIPKPHEALVNGVSYNKKLRKPQPKSKEASPKAEEILSSETCEEPKKETDFHPKRIIKRGSELEDVVKRSVSVSPPKENISNQPGMLMIDTIIPNLKLINNIRGLVSQSSDDSIINSAVNFLKNEISSVESTETAIKFADDAHKEYIDSVMKIKDCSDKTCLPSLKLERDLRRVHLCDKLKEYLGSCDNTIFERKEKIQKIIIDLESNSNAWMNVQLKKKPETVEELVQEYSKVKEEKWNLVSRTRTNTNVKHKQFMNVLATIQKEFYLNTLEEDAAAVANSNVPSIDKNTSYSNQLDETLSELGKAVDEEIQTLTMNKEPGNYSIIQCLLDILDVHKEKIDVLCELYENRYALLNDLTKLPNIEETVMGLKNAQDEACHLSEELFRQIEEKHSENELQAARKELHQALLKEDRLKGVLAKVTESHFPELYIEIPELSLHMHLKNRFYLKNWNPAYFMNDGITPRGESSYFSVLLDESVIIKEYSFTSQEECNAFIQKALLWNKIKSDFIVKFKALFVKDECTVCVMLPQLLNTLMESAPSPTPVNSEKSCRILRQVLTGLRDIHAGGFVHHAVHPLTVIIENEKAMLDFCFESNYLVNKGSLKDINFLSPEHKAMHATADMYGFGCLVLWILFPNLTFTATEDGVPNIAAFRSIIEEMILPKDYALLSGLVDANPERRPSACRLLMKGFLSKYENYCRSRCDAAKNA